MSGGLLPGSYTGLCSCFSLFLHLSESISCGKVNLVYPPQKVGKKIIPVVHWEVSRKGELSRKEINGVLLTAMHKVLIFCLVLINHNFWNIQMPKKTSRCDSIPSFPLAICHFVTFYSMTKKKEAKLPVIKF